MKSGKTGKFRLLLPLMLLAMLIMASSVYAKPSFVKGTVTFKQSCYIFKSEYDGKYYMSVEYYNNVLEKGLQLKGVSSKAQIYSYSISFGSGSGFPELVRKNGKTYLRIAEISGGHGKQYSINTNGTGYLLSYGNTGTGTYKVKTLITDKGKKQALTLTVKNSNTFRSCYSSLTIGGKSYTSQLHTKGINIAKITTTTGKQVTVRFKTPAAYKSYKKIFVVSNANGGSLKVYNNGAKITLHAGDTIALGKSKSDMLLPVVVNYDYSKHLTNSY